MGGSSKGGGGGHTPVEKPNTLESAQRLKIIDLLCEGVAGNDVSFQNIYLDNTPIQNADGSYNFTGIKVSALAGTHDQDYLAGFDSTDKVVSVGTEVTADTPITRTITSPLIDSVRVTLALGSLVTMKDNGDRVGGSVSLTVKCGDKSYPVTISGKTTSSYHQDVLLTDLPDTPFNISVHRNTPDSTTDKVSNATHWVSYVESIDAKFNYPNSVVVGLEIDSAQFGNSVPKRTYLNKWTQIKVPNNYNPQTRSYNGIWNGEFKTAWSNNPAWVFYDLVTDKRYGLGDRMGDFGCDKWALYQIAKYCDQIVPDGFGGTEPRFTCNAYLSEPRDAKSLLDDLASVFRGIAVWNGTAVTALQDAKKDPVATYSNSNVVDGAFSYSGSAQKTIFTAVHVKYNDKTANYTTKTEYVANDEAIKRYGLNVKQITAFGCTSRGQAARVGKWLIETSIRERQMVSFKVGREGIRHLPFDIIEIADNDYAGDMIGGRVLDVNGRVITVDSEVVSVDSIRYYANGQSKVVDVESIDGGKITLADTPVGIELLGVFSATKTDVKPRLFRALSIKEDDGTYTISAVTHDENKESIVDDGVTFEQDNTATKHTPQISYGNVSKDGDELLIAWEGTNTTQYLIKIYKDGKLYKSYTQDTPEIRLKGLSNGDYKAEIRGKSANGQLTEAVIKEWTIDYTINGLIATPELFAIKLNWTNPTTVLNKAHIEVYRSQTDSQTTASKVATLSYPTDTFTQNGVKLSETHYFWLRIVDDQGNTGDWVKVSGQCSNDTSPIVESINGQITETALAKSLIDSLQSDIDSAKTQAIKSATEDTINKIAGEAKARTNAIQAKAYELGTKISEVKTVSDEQAQKLDALTSSQSDLISGLEEEKKARASGDIAEAKQRLLLISKVDNALLTSASYVFTNKEQFLREWHAHISCKNLIFTNHGTVYIGANKDKYDYGWYISKKKLAMSDQSLYKITYRFQKESGDGRFYAGVTGYDKDDKLLSSGEREEYNNQWYAYQTDTNSNWQTVEIYIAGSDVDTKRLSNVIKVAGKVRKIAPLFIANYANKKGRVKINSITVELVTTTASLSYANLAKIEKEIKTRVTEDHALSMRIDSTISTANDNAAKITTLSATLTDNKRAISKSVTQLTSKIDNSLLTSASYVFTNKEQFLREWHAHISCKNLIFTDHGTVYVGSNKDKGDYGWYISKKKLAMSDQSLYKITYRFQKESGDGRFYAGVTGYDKNDKLFSSRGREESGSQWYAYQTDTNSNWQTVEIYIAGSDVDTKRLSNVIKVAGKVRKIAPLFIANYANKKGRVKINSITVELVTASIGVAKSMYTIKTQAIAGGRKAIAGISMGAMANETTTESQVIVMADKFGVVKNASDGSVKPIFSVVNNKVAVSGDLIADGTILGKHIKANQTITAPSIKGGSLNINNRFKVDKYGNVTAKSGVFEGTVYASRIKGNVANIADAAVDTLQIKGEAVIVPRVQFTASPFEFYSIDTEEEINRLTIDAKGGGVSISFGFESLEAKAGGDNEGNNGRVNIRIKRNDKILRVISFEASGYYLYDSRRKIKKRFFYESFINLPTFLDTPPTGPHTYTVTLESRGLNSGKNSNDRAQFPVIIKGRSLHLIGARR